MKRIELDWDDSSAVVLATEVRARAKGDDVMVLRLAHQTGRLKAYEYVAVNPRFVGDSIDIDDQPQFRPVNVVGLTKGASSDPEVDFVYLDRGSLIDDEGTTHLPKGLS